MSSEYIVLWPFLLLSFNKIIANGKHKTELQKLQRITAKSMLKKNAVYSRNFYTRTHTQCQNTQRLCDAYIV